MTVTTQHAQELTQGAKQLNVALSEQQQEQLLQYLGLLIKWNKAYNLTAVRNPDEMVSRHLLDSLSMSSSTVTTGWMWAAAAVCRGFLWLLFFLKENSLCWTLMGKKHAF